MTRSAEAALLAVPALLAAMGVALVNFTGDGGLDAQVGLTLVVFVFAFGGIHLALRRWAPRSSQLLFPIAALLTALGAVAVYRVDPALGAQQRWWVLVASGAAVLTLFLLREEGVAVLRRYRYLFLAAAIVLLMLPLLPENFPLYGVEINGSRLWVRIDLPLVDRTMSFQPGEISKLLIVVFLASYLSERRRALTAMSRTLGKIPLPEPRQLGPVLVAAALAFGVLIYQRDLGASLLLFAVFVTMLYAATSQVAYLITGGFFVIGGGAVAYQLLDHVQRRVSAWLHPFDDFADSGYQVAQGLFAMGSGSLTGSGLGLGRPDLIPAASTDFVFAVVAEEMGLAGSIAVIAAFAMLVAVGLGIALRSGDTFRKLLAAGLTMVLAIQAILILGGVLRVLPLTGIALPFMSYGGSSLLSNMIALALLARISHGSRA